MNWWKKNYFPKSIDQLISDPKNNMSQETASTTSHLNLQAIILAGGLGTRLRPVVNDVPKCMAPVAGKPFLQYVIQHLQRQGVHDFIFSLGYMSDTIETFLAETYPGLHYQVIVENTSLGTGGAIRFACARAHTEDVLALNGDTLFEVEIDKIAALHWNSQADCTLALKPMKNFNRYGVVETGGDQRIISFKEKQEYATGLINGGVYLINRKKLLACDLPEKFSFEKDYLERYVAAHPFFGLAQDAYFIDIGIPEDFEKAQSDFVSK